MKMSKERVHASHALARRKDDGGRKEESAAAAAEFFLSRARALRSSRPSRDASQRLLTRLGGVKDAQRV